MTFKLALIGRFLTTILSSLLGADLYAQEVCAPVLALPGVIHTTAYDPFAHGPVIDNTTIALSGATCDADTTITATIGWGSNEPRLTYNGQELRFSMFVAGIDLSSSARAFSDLASPLNRVSIDVPAGTVGNLPQQARLIIPEGQVVAPGTYQLIVPSIAQSGIGLLTQTSGTSDIRSTPITLSTQVLAVMKLGVTGCDLSSDGGSQGTSPSGGDLVSACTLSLGDPATGMVNGDGRVARLNARANVNFKISMMSKNGGVMRLSNGLTHDRETEKLPYTATLAGQGQSSVYRCNASNCGTSELIEPSNSPLGTDLFFQVRVNDPDISQKRAGIYSDTITLIIQPAS